MWFMLVLSAVVLAFGLVVAFGPPYVPTLTKQMMTALDLLELKPGQTLLELGSGDGKVAIAAAERGLKVVGIELNPLLVVLSRLRTRKYKGNVRIIWGNYFQVAWPQADGIFTFMIQRQMGKLDRRVTRWHTKTVRLASFAFRIPHKEADAEKDGVYLYEYRK